MTKRAKQLSDLIDEALRDAVPPGLKVAIDDGLRKGASKFEILRIAKARLEKDAPLVLRSVEIYVANWKEAGNS